MKLKNAITDVRGIEVGHAQDEEALTGCTVILCRKGAVAGVDVLGRAKKVFDFEYLREVYRPANLRLWDITPCRSCMATIALRGWTRNWIAKRTRFKSLAFG